MSEIGSVAIPPFRLIRRAGEQLFGIQYLAPLGHNLRTRLFSNREYEIIVHNAPTMIKDLLFELNVPHSFNATFSRHASNAFVFSAPVDAAIARLRQTGLNHEQWAFFTAITSSFQLMIHRHDGRNHEFRLHDCVLSTIDPYNLSRHFLQIASRWGSFSDNLKDDEWLVEPMMSVVDEN
ncbi:hypothetical protein F5Y18DRAFT_429459 [Xylariaceae sp. FL1019]|nr:hypothetical protein F5Y18DRAFT_429459 [Xylariaceae sp. FL1019]